MSASWSSSVVSAAYSRSLNSLVWRMNAFISGSPNSPPLRPAKPPPNPLPPATPSRTPLQSTTVESPSSTVMPASRSIVVIASSASQW
jgi:hypothetical protein